MEIKDLRIGNILRWNNSITLNVNDGAIALVDINVLRDFNHYNDGWIIPIPLTEEWILKFNFQNKGSSRYGQKYILPMADWGFTIETHFESGKWFFGHEFYDSGDDNWDNTTLNFCFNLQYVHQLQNLFFALTGEELIWKQVN